MDLKICVRRLAGCMAAAAAISGCGGGGSPTPTGPQADLTRSRGLWSRKGPRSYRYTLQLGCFCAPASTQPVVIVVRNGAPVSVTTLTGDALAPGAFSSYDTIEELFTAIQRTLDGHGKVVRAVYDPSLGFPASASLDPVPMAIDDELTISVRDFQAL